MSTGQWINLSELQKLTRGQYNLHSQSIQSVQERYIQARTNAWEDKKKDGFSISPEGHILLKMCILNGKRQTPIKVKVALLPQGKKH
ncbi:MAG TPA: hypothetical protein VFD33_04535 [Bacillota bacterium]|nr:hypothetical protein [Bacillota bacterium]